ncbi:MAG TPA: trypsin-like peptidase domain-containing protein [Tepidisphaeraceae bacterium]|nr:trypsin-like peptidase domain-containing protein [Tepidisphaeraceae bacterium]
MYRAFAASFVAVTGFCVSSADAVLVFGGTPSSPTASRQLVSTTPPPAGSGQEYVGLYGTSGETRYLGVPIAPQHFITAKHVYSEGTGLVLGNTTYTFHSAHLDPNSDLAIVKVNETFPQFAPLYTGTSEVGKAITIFGRGKTAGSLLQTGSGASSVNNGWLVDGTAVDDRQVSWAADTVDAVANGRIRWNFPPTPGSSTLTDKDSGGPVFINDGGVTKLAGVNYGISSPFSLSSSGSSPFTATVFNAENLYANAGTAQAPNWVAVSGVGFSAATRISDHQAFIAGVVPEPTAPALLALSGLALLRRRREPSGT